MQLNFAAREVTIKLVYYGPALSGKTTNLRSLHQLTTEDSRGRLMTLETKDDRTLFFDMLPLVFRAEAATVGANDAEGMSLRIKVFTVPGQVLHASTRRLVLQGADGVAFIADSQISETENNAASFLDLRDEPEGARRSRRRRCRSSSSSTSATCRTCAPTHEIGTLASRGREPVFKASAVNGDGVLESFFGLLHLTWSQARRRAPAREDARASSSADFLPMAAAEARLQGRRATSSSARCVGGVAQDARREGAP